MATNITIRDGGFSDAKKLTWQAAAANMELINDGNLVLLVRAKTGASSTLVTVQGAPEPKFGRDVDKTVTLVAGEEAFIGPLDPSGFNQPSGVNQGKVMVDFGAITNVEVVAVRLQRS